MKVKELIAELQKMPQDFIVLLENSDGNMSAVGSVIKGFNELDGAVILGDYFAD